MRARVFIVDVEEVEFPQVGRGGCNVPKLVWRTVRPLVRNIWGPGTCDAFGAPSYNGSFTDKVATRAISSLTGNTLWLEPLASRTWARARFDGNWPVGYMLSACNITSLFSGLMSIPNIRNDIIYRNYSRELRWLCSVSTLGIHAMTVSSNCGVPNRCERW